MLQLPPSKIISISSCISLYTSWALVGDGLPDLFAEGAAIGHPDLSIKNLAISSEGFLIATVSPPQLTTSLTLSLFLKIIVNGPGHKLSINFFWSSVISDDKFFTISSLVTCKINGLSLFLLFTSNIFLQASSSNPFAPNP